MAVVLEERPLTADDVDALADLMARRDAAIEDRRHGDRSERFVEAGALLDRVDDLEVGSVGLVLDGALAGASLVVAPQRAVTVVDPVDVAVARAAYERVMAWLVSAGCPTISLLAGDRVGAATAADAEWSPRGRYEEMRLDPGPAPLPVWPRGVAVTDGPLAADDARGVHELVYRRSGWGDVVGHRARSLDDWRRHLVAAGRPGLQPVARIRGVPVGVALCEVSPTGAGEVRQLAVDRRHEGRGLGRALLLESFRRLAAAGATRRGLGVHATNTRALALYRSVGLVTEREWVHWAPPAPPPG